MSYTTAPQTPPLRPTLHANVKSRPHLRVVDTSLNLDEDHYLQEDDIDLQQCSPLSPVSSSPWEEASTASTTASIPSTPTTQVSVNEPLLSRDLSSKSQILLSEPIIPEAIKVPPESFGGPIHHVPPRWALHGDIYTFSFWTSAEAASSLPEHAYSPLEGTTSFADETFSRPVGGLSMIQILSYRDSPIGPYDEMLVAPGLFDWERTEPGGKKTKGRNPKITRIYVSTPNSCFNGRTSKFNHSFHLFFLYFLWPMERTPGPLSLSSFSSYQIVRQTNKTNTLSDWNTPKHLAKFVWDHRPDGSTTIKIYPHDDPSNPDESHPSSVPFFQTTFKPMPLVPRFPFATSWADCLGFNTTLVMPPLPSGHGTYGELPSTNRWISLETKQYCKRSTVGWYDVAQPDQGAACGGHKNFLPWLKRWQVGLKMEDADLSFEIPAETWERGDKLSDTTSDDEEEEEEEFHKTEPEKWNTTFLHDYFT
jgi:hypothetical protein